MIKKRTMKAMISNLLICAFLIVASTNLFAQQETIDDTTTENAAVHYSKAIDLLQYPKSQEAKNKIKVVIETGWQEDDELEELLNQNEMCRREFKKGLSLKKCDFDFGKEYKYLVAKEMPPFLEFRNLSNLLLLKARYYENQVDFNKTIDIYLSLLTFAQHISQDNSLISKVWALAVEKGALTPLKDCLSSKQINKKEYLEILDYLEDYEKQHFSLEQALEGEKKFFISNLQMLVDNIDAEQKFNEDEKRKTVVFGNEILKQGHLLANYYYGILIKAATTNKGVNWDVVDSEIQNLQKEAKSKGIFLEAIGDIVKNKPQDLNEKLASQIVKITLAMSLPDFRKVVNSYYLTLKELKELKSLASIKAR